jgi:hypothetical protein
MAVRIPCTTSPLSRFPAMNRPLRLSGLPAMPHHVEAAAALGKGVVLQRCWSEVRIHDVAGVLVKLHHPLRKLLRWHRVAPWHW